MPDVDATGQSQGNEGAPNSSHDSNPALSATLSVREHSLPTQSPAPKLPTVETLSYADAPATKPSGAAPERIGRYRVLNELGSGSFGKVYRCHDAQLQRDVAAKLAHQRETTQKQTASEFLHEARSAARLRHPGIVAVLDTGQTDDGRVYILFEFVSGRTLKERMEVRDFTREQGLLWLAEVGDALHYAHKQGLVHRDVKPGNILVDDAGHTRVADFGLAMIDDRFYSQDAGRVLGTVAYMSPEQARGQSHWATPQSDVYALGVIMYEMLCGRRPFTGGSVSDLLEQVQQRPATPPRTVRDDVPEELEEICLRAMAKDPAARYRTAADFSADVRRAVRGRASSPLKYVLGAVAAAGLVAAIVWGRSSNNDDGKSVAGVAPVATATVAAPELEIHWQRKDDTTDNKVLREGDVPLHDGDKVQLHAVLDRPGYVYLYWYDSHGRPQRLWPDPKRPLAGQQPASEIWSPRNAERGSQSEWWPISGKPGAEMAFAAVADHELSAAELATFEARTFSLDQELSRRDTLVEFERSVSSRKSRSRGLGANPVVSPKKVLRDFEPQLNTLFTYYHGWVFYHE